MEQKEGQLDHELGEAGDGSQFILGEAVGLLWNRTEIGIQIKRMLEPNS